MILRPGTDAPIHERFSSNSRGVVYDAAKRRYLCPDCLERVTPDNPLTGGACSVGHHVP